jgi:hypothetical protein
LQPIGAQPYFKNVFHRKHLLHEIIPTAGAASQTFLSMKNIAWLRDGIVRKILNAEKCMEYKPMSCRPEILNELKQNCKHHRV